MKKVIVTTSWDDGHKLDLKLAKLLKKYGIKGTFYVSPKNKEFAKSELLTNSDIKELNKNFEIGAHTMTHINLAQSDNKKAKKEIRDSKNYLEKLIGKKILSFCYPYGAFNKETKTIVKQLGFQLARSTKRFSFKSSTDHFELKTSIHAYNHISDLLKIALLSKGNLLKFIKYLNWENLAKKTFDDVYKNGGEFHLWGHSWEIEKNNHWEKLENVLKYIHTKKRITHLVNSDLLGKKKPNKLMVVTPYFYPTTGGLENYAYNVAKGLKNLYGWEIVVVTSNHQSNPEVITENIDGIKVYRLPILWKLSNTPINPFWYFQIKKIINSEQPDLINAHAPVPFISDIAALASGKIPFILTYHAGTMKKNKFLNDILVWVYENIFSHYIFNKAQSIISSSDYIKENFLKKYSYKVDTITPGVDTKLFKPSAKKFKNKILFVGGLKKAEQYKGLKYLLQAIKEIKKHKNNIQLTVVGNGDYINVYKKMCKDLSIEKNVDFKENKIGHQLIQEYQKANVLVLPSLNDSFGMVLIEAMACKTPVIGFNAGGIPAVIKNNKDGLLVTPKDIQDLSQAIIKLLENKKRAKRMGENGYKKVVNNFTWEKQLHKTNNLISTIPFVEGRLAL